MSSSLSNLRKQQQLAAHAHRMRVAPSEPERVLWLALRASQLGVPFRRQVVLQGYIVDFFAPAARLVVEVDGVHHVLRRGADARTHAQSRVALLVRTQWRAERGGRARLETRLRRRHDVRRRRPPRRAKPRRKDL